MKQKHLVSIRDHTRAEIEEIFDLARRVKASPGEYSQALRGKSLGMIFLKPSTRTRVSFEVAMFQLGGHALNLGADEIQLHRGETVADTARVLSRYVDGIMARVFSHEDLVEMSRHATVPVINGLSDLLHPVQALADFFTLLERRGRLDGLTLAYVGDGNNMCHALMIGAVKLGVAMRVAVPGGYEPNQLIVKSAAREAQKLRTAAPLVTPDPMEAVQGADAVYTDVWTSMGQEAESEARRQAFAGYGVSAEMMGRAAPDAVFMHCLPAHRGEEVSAEVIDGPQSVVFDQVENRLHVQKAILMLLMGGGEPPGPPSTLRA
ncbi:MAG TPA: ornithine carbamoyltransferase [Vicinamibacteria bacterium]|nr:ornithine carbamoyltransferase [Vicinamibacteria bacterium]